MYSVSKLFRGTIMHTMRGLSVVYYMFILFEIEKVDDENDPCDNPKEYSRYLY